MPYTVEVIRGIDDTPLGELGLGVEFLGRFTEAGGKVASWEWVYGGAARNPFPPHLSLDGTRRETLDGWANASGFPSFAFFFPADHAGCWCATVPTLEPASIPRPVPTSAIQALPVLKDLVKQFLDDFPDRELTGVEPIAVGAR